ncbi:MAG: YkgJ family cysteine cluster protein [Treponema sp.]|nr:YkgJ family cysteine cluster protein [Treponema sp.]
MEPFFASGLRFSCKRCSACCRHESGFVFLSKRDLSLLAVERQMGYTEFVKVYCRWVPGERGGECLSLKEKSNYDCIFWDQGCTVYEVRPVQCRTFPFWRNVLSSPTAWELAASGCPGIGGGILHSRDRIEACLAERAAEPPVYRGI